MAVPEEKAPEGDRNSASGEVRNCPLCQHVGPDLWWGETWVSEPAGWENRDLPPEVARMEALPADVYRCPQCGSYFDQKASFNSWLNSEWESFWLERRPARTASGAVDPVAHVHDSVRTQDLSALRPSLLAAEDEARWQAWNALKCHFLGGVEVSVLEPFFTEILAPVQAVPNKPDVRSWAAQMLTLHLLRSGRANEVLPLLAGDRAAAIRFGALCGVGAATETATDRQPLRPLLQRARAMLGDIDENMRFAAGSALVHAGIRVSPAARAKAMAEAGLHALGSDRPEMRRDAAETLGAAARAGHDVSAAVERLAALLTDPVAGGAARMALFSATAKADLGAVLAELRRLLPYDDDLSRGAGAILTSYFVHHAAWDEFPVLLEEPPDQVSEQCCRELGSLAREHDLAPLVPVLQRVAAGQRPKTSAAAAAALAAIDARA